VRARSAGMDVSLTENPDGCPSFEPNPFKTQKCKNCGRLWTEHLGVITEAQIATYRKSLQKAADDKSAKEAEAKAKAKAKATAKKKAQQAVEDEWLFDGGASTEDQKTIALDDSDDDMGFRMYLGSEVGSAPVDSRQARPSETAKTLKVVNLIDFGECDVPEEIEASSSSTSFNMISPPAPAVAPPPVSMPTPAAPSSSETASAAVVKPPPPPGRSGRSASPGAHLKSGLGAGMRDHEEALLAEIEHLRQQLDDAAQERQIQVEMIKDDVLEKQKQVEELSQKNSDMEAALKSAKQEALELKQGLTAAQEEAVNRETEIQTLRIQAAELKEKLEVAEAQAASQPQAAQAAQDAQAAQQRAAEAQAELQRLRGEVQAAATASAVEQEAHSQALQRLSQERDALTSEVQSLRQLQEESKANNGVTAKEQSVSEEVTALLSEACHICKCTLRLLADDSQSREASMANDIAVPADLERSLRMLRDTASALQTAAERADADRRLLSQQLANARQTPTPLDAPKPAVGTPLEAVANPSPEGAALAPGFAPPPKDNATHPVSAEAQAAANAVSREAAKALREVRLNAERQLAWISQRMRNGAKALPEGMDIVTAAEDENVAPPKMNTTCGI